MVNGTEQILNELREIRIDIGFIKEHIVDPDTILTPEDKIALQEAREEFKQGKTISLEEFKKEMAENVRD